MEKIKIHEHSMQFQLSTQVNTKEVSKFWRLHVQKLQPYSPLYLLYLYCEKNMVVMKIKYHFKVQVNCSLWLRISWFCKYKIYIAQLNKYVGVPMQKNYCKCNTVHFASTGVHTICGEPSVIQDILLPLPHLLMNDLLNKNYQVCYHI